MKKIGLQDFCNYHYLSNLNATPCSSRLLFVDTTVNADKTDYQQRMLSYDLASKKLSVLLDNKKSINYFILAQGDLLVVNDEDKDNKYIHSDFDRLCSKSGNVIDSFTLPLDVNDIKTLNEDTYIVNASINVNHPDYFKYSKAKKDEYLKQEEDNKDYLEFDEYPYTYNGAGVIVGRRSALFLVDKKTLKIKRITKPTMNVDSFDFVADRIVYSGNDYASVKVITNEVYEYDLKTNKTKCLYDEPIQIQKVFFDKNRLIVIGIKDRGFGDFSYGRFYELRANKLKLICDNELSLYNAVITDVRFGKTRNYYKYNGVSYFVSCSDSRSPLYVFEDDGLKPVSDFEGTIDDFVVTDRGIYAIALKQQLLQEIYRLDNPLRPLTKLNSLKEYYVAKPKRITIEKKVPFAGWVLLPENFNTKKKYPAILNIHGGPKCAYGEVFYHEMQHLVSLGYVIFFCNPRGSDGRGEDFANIKRQYGGIDYEDLMDFTDEVLSRYPNIDSKRLGVMGGSYGGFMTNWIVSQTDRFKVAASQRSISNWISEVCTSDYGIDFPIGNEFTDLYHCDSELWALSPLRYANNVKTATLFIHATEDYRCTFSEGLQYYTAIKLNGVDTKLVGFKGENHELSRSGKPKHRVKRLTEIVNWMNKYIGEE